MNWLWGLIAGAVVFAIFSLIEGPLKTWASVIAGVLVLLAVGIISETVKAVKRRKPENLP